MGKFIDIEIDEKALAEHASIIANLMLERNDLGYDFHRYGSSGNKALYKSIVKYLESAQNKLRKEMIKAYQSNLGGRRGDPRAARYSVQRGKAGWDKKEDVIRGIVKILQPKTAGSKKTSYFPERKLDKNPHQRGGNRRPRSARTEALQTYGPMDRGFILRFLEGGTAQRQTRFGNRGSIAPRNIFGRVSPFLAQALMDEVAQKINARIEDLVSKGKKF